MNYHYQAMYYLDNYWRLPSEEVQGRRGGAQTPEKRGREPHPRPVGRASVRSVRHRQEGECREQGGQAWQVLYQGRKGGARRSCESRCHTVHRRGCLLP